MFGEEMGDGILDIPRLPLTHKDKLVWKQKQDGEFSVKSAYVVDQGHRFDDTNTVWNWLWYSQLHPRISMILRRLLNSALPVKEKLPLLREKDCHFCEAAVENCLHLFKDCCVAKLLWFSSVFPLRIDKIPGQTMISFVENLVATTTNSGFGRKEVLTFLGCMVGQIWKTSNECSLAGKPIIMDQARKRIEEAYEGFVNFSYTSEEEVVGLRTQVTPHLTQRSIRRLNEERPLCTDASWVKGDAGSAVVMLKEDTVGWSYKLARDRAVSALEAELKAILLALNWALEEGWNEIHVLSDCLQAIQTLNKNRCP
ncbi:uncharacterized protein LOC115717998 [Cannabis sativa]|uniref:uncharacterized protein LOC115717998 n=1 Tax=Cannabis sativa TaxID=3483 RepID=UPI0029CA465B|nr:uncharacterized protein LOC115717998 [Cannabis sativa]